MQLPLEQAGECPLVTHQTAGLDDELVACRSRPLHGRDNPASIELDDRKCVIIDDVQDEAGRRGPAPEGQAQRRFVGLEGFEAQDFRVTVEILVPVVERSLPGNLGERAIPARVVAEGALHREREETARRIDLRPPHPDPQAPVIGRDLHPGENPRTPSRERAPRVPCHPPDPLRRPRSSSIVRFGFRTGRPGPSWSSRLREPVDRRSEPGRSH